jgi:hypothetical protein
MALVQKVPALKGLFLGFFRYLTKLPFGSIIVYERTFNFSQQPEDKMNQVSSLFDQAAAQCEALFRQDMTRRNVPIIEPLAIQSGNDMAGKAY